MTNRRTICCLASAVALGLAGNASANLIADNYHGADGHGYGDVIGATSDFQIHNADMSLSGNLLTVTINTNLAGKADQKLFSNYTKTAPSTWGGQYMGIGYGDVFLTGGSTQSWAPDGTLANNYNTDDHANGTNWSYGFSIDGNRWTDAGGTGTLYKLTGSNNDSALLTEDFMSGATYRNGQEVAVDRSAASYVTDTGVDGTWSVTPGSSVSYTFDISGTDMWGTSPGDTMYIAMHWAMSCGNDTIEGETVFFTPPGFTVPEPGVLGLSMLGLAGVGAWRRRKRAS